MRPYIPDHGQDAVKVGRRFDGVVKLVTTGGGEKTGCGCLSIRSQIRARVGRAKARAQRNALMHYGKVSLVRSRFRQSQPTELAADRPRSSKNKRVTTAERPRLYSGGVSFRITSSRLKLAGFWRMGNSLKL